MQGATRGNERIGAWNIAMKQNLKVTFLSPTSSMIYFAVAVHWKCFSTSLIVGLESGFLYSSVLSIVVQAGNTTCVHGQVPTKLASPRQ